MFDARKLPNIAEELALLGELEIADRLMEVVESLGYQDLVDESLDGGFRLAVQAAWEAIEAAEAA